MKKALLILLLTGSAWSEPLCLQPQFELQMAPGSIQNNVERDPEAAVRLLEDLWATSGPRLGNRWVESCYLLALGDMRARAAWNAYLEPYEAGDLEILDKLNRTLVPRGISLHAQLKSGAKQGPVVEIVSLGGLEYTSHQSKHAWMQPYDRSTGWAGYYKWMSECRKRAEAQGPTGSDALEGFLLGYPDSAVQGYLGPGGQHSYAALESWLPEVGYFECGLPTYVMMQEQGNSPDVLENERSWHHFLAAVYGHPRLQALVRSAPFDRARKEHLKATGKQDAGSGYTTDEVTTAHWRWVCEHRAELQGALAEADSSRDLAERLGTSSGLHWTEHMFRSAIIRGALYPQGPWAIFTQAARKHNAFRVVLRKELAYRSRSLPRETLAKNEIPVWRASTNDFLDLLTLPETVDVVAEDFQPDEARAWFHDVWLLRQFPEARSLLARIQTGQILKQRLEDLRKPWVWPPGPG